uniref:Uncharacterized protein n=1 Tax=Ciona savignyi TaxID=51511 RepID=H2Z2Y4_CIOSA
MPLKPFEIPEDLRFIGHQQYVYKFKIIFNSSISQSLVPLLQNDLELAIEHIILGLPKFRSHKIRSISTNTVYIKLKLRIWKPYASFTEKGKNLQPYRYSYILFVYLNEDETGQLAKEPVIYASDESLDLSTNITEQGHMISAETMHTRGMPHLSLSPVDLARRSQRKRCNDDIMYRKTQNLDDNFNRETSFSKRIKLSSTMINDEDELNVTNNFDDEHQQTSGHDKLHSGTSGQLQTSFSETKKASKRERSSRVARTANDSNVSDGSWCVIL